MARLVGVPDGHPGTADAAYMRVPLLGDGVGLIDEDRAGEHWAALPELFQFITDVEPVFVNRTGDEFDLDINDGALLDGVFDRRGHRDREVLAPVISLSAQVDILSKLNRQHYLAGGLGTMSTWVIVIYCQLARFMLRGSECPFLGGLFWVAPKVPRVDGG